MNDRRRCRVLGKKLASYPDAYLILLRIRAALKEKKHITPRLYSAAAEKLKSADLRLTAEAYTDYMAYRNRLSGFREEEICAVDHAAALVILRVLFAQSHRGTHRASFDALVENAALTLRSLDDESFRERYISLSSLDEYLREHDPIYKLCDQATQDDQKSRIVAYAKKHRIDETAAAAILRLHPPVPDTKRRALAYFGLIGLITLALGLLSLGIGLPFWAFPLLLFPAFSLAKELTEALFRRLVPTHPIPKRELRTIPEEGATAVVITTVLSSTSREPFERLERFYLSNREEEVRFGLLCDLPDAQNERENRDEELLAFAEEAITALNTRYPNRFFLAVRHRSYSRSEKAYIGRERKRGALIDLVRFMKDETDAFRLFLGDTVFLRKARYLLTLDADTNLFIGAVKKMVGAMLHPDNRPQIENGAVRRGYGVLQPRMAVTASSAAAGRFSLLLCGSGGPDVYASATFDVYQTLFGEGIFCGKGIFDIDAFYQLIPDAFQEERILSHDLLEGNLLRAGFLSDVVLTDSFPQNPLSYYSRMHRWCRGDVQALPYGLATVKRADGVKRKNPVNALSRYKVWDNLRRLLTDGAQLLLFLAALLLSPEKQTVMAAFLLILTAAPALLSLLRPRHDFFRRYYARILSGAPYVLFNLLFSLASLPHRAFVSLDALLRAVFRMTLSHRHLLLWRTAARDDKKKNGAFAYLWATRFSSAVGFLTLTFAQSAVLRLLGILWMTFPLTLVWLSRRYPARPKAITQEEKALLSRYVFDMWGYFKRFVTENEHFLPPDNYQILPVKALAHRTSPTNIGLYLLALLAARDFGFIDTKELSFRSAATLETLEKLPKKHGHLYNWYDTTTLALLGAPFVSTVDSGNFIVSLVTFVEGLKEYQAEEAGLARVIRGYEALIEACDFSYLYCEKRALFYIARDGEEPSSASCYDLYMSEARTTSFYAVASGLLPKKHWERLRRIPIGKGRHLGLASWSGTTFEYFMPHLFLPIVPGSLSDEALAFCAERQKEEKREGLFGISESAYYAFDADMNYQYRAHGADSLSLDAAKGRDRVIAPYASFLMLSVIPHTALNNLKALRAFGAYGEFGFYEAVDFTPESVGKGSEIIRSFMAHHVGMSIVAAANACHDNLFVRRFMRDARMASAAELLEERIPTQTPLFKGKLVLQGNHAKSFHLPPEINDKKWRTEKKNDRLPKIALFSNGSLSLKVTSAGACELLCRNVALSRPCLTLHRHEGPLSSLRLVFAENGKAYAATPDLFSYSGTKAVFTTQRGKLTVKTTFTLHGERDLAVINFSAVGTAGLITPTLLFEPLLADIDAFASHPFYRSLSIEALYQEEEHLLLFYSRERENEGEKWLAVSVEGEGEIGFDSRKDALPFNYTESDVQALAQKTPAGRTGPVLSPLALMRIRLKAKNARAACDFLIAYGSSRNEVTEHILSVRQSRKASIVESVSDSLRPVLRRMQKSIGEERPAAPYTELYLSALFYPEKSAAASTVPTPPQSLWAASISGDYPILALLPTEDMTESGERLVRIFLKLHRLMREKGVKSDLCFLCREKDPYNKPLSKRIGKLVAAEAGNSYLGKKGGLFILSDRAQIETVSSLSCLSVPLDRDTSPEELCYRVTSRRGDTPLPIQTKSQHAAEVVIPNGALRVQGGFFHQNAFTVIPKECDTPRSFVYASSHFGTLVSAASPGFTWVQNAKECRLTPPSDDLLCDFTAERVLWEKDGTFYDLCAMADSVRFDEGAALWQGTLFGEEYTVEIGVDRLLPVKLILVKAPPDSRIHYHVTPSFSAKELYAHLLTCKKDGRSRFWQQMASPHLADRTVFLSRLEESDTRHAFLFGVYPTKSEKVYHKIRAKYRDADAVEAGFLEYASYYRNLFSALRFRLPRPEFEVMLNRFVPYQAYVIRMLARTGYHQSSGAYGFRDQLQDSLAMLFYEEAITKRQIFRAAAHQYAEGDVQHWWHPFTSAQGTNAGLRTRISDDKLWLPFAVAEYCEKTGDRSILAVEIAYLSSKPLAEGELDRYEIPEKTPQKESLYRHCMRAIEASLKFSPEGLPLIGTGDWNDAFDRVGAAGRGTSVFLARFMQIVFTAFAPLCESVHDDDSAAFLRKSAKKLSEAVEKHAKESDRYLRGRYDNGAPLGSALSKECKIDILAQSFSAMAEGPNESTLRAMETAYQCLFDPTYKLLRLFDPPFGPRKKDAGYISSYCEGFRENGGQYNHGALFGALGFFALGEKRRALAILEGVNPAYRCMNAPLASAYHSEPYALCGDIYTHPAYRGRGGWSLYTGAAGWFLTTTLQALLGYREYADFFTLSPALSEKFPSFSLKLTRKNTVYHISVTLSDKTRLLLDAHKSENRFFFDGGHHILEMDIEKGREM